ncbi:hypothetical protein [Thauera aromatica]|uniref:hypothetical protein n=1 Tax=Thauera aromatica TaxID=59405 RepID=UPI001FFDC314|nr:hypothetical protein [Thauera aromatica]MCK2095980.1 hypothetical protein [Thauera aromatica]
MDRREFFRRAGGGASLAALSTSALSFQNANFATGRTQLILVGQGDLPAAVALTHRLEETFHATGLRTTVLLPARSELRRIGDLDALLDHPPGTPLLGIMDDAAAVIFQAVAGSRGAHSLASAHHRGSAGTTRHCCSATGYPQPIAWHGAGDGRTRHVEQFYLAALGEGAAPSAANRSAAAATAAEGALASFLIRL